MIPPVAPIKKQSHPFFVISRKDVHLQGTRASIIAQNTLRFEPFDLPDTPGSGELLVQMERTIISAGTELANYTGLEPATRVPGSWCYYPWNPGYGGIGRVLKAGTGTAHFTEGDLVYGIFGHASHAVVNTRSQIAVKVPEGMDLNHAVCARMACVAITGYHRAEVKMGDSIAIIGLGLVGNLCGQFFALDGRAVIGLDPVAKRRQLAEACGFTATFDPSDPDLKDKIQEVSHGRGARVVVDAVGQSRLVEQAIDLVAKWGQVILLGSPRADYEANWTPALMKVHYQGIDVKGALEWIYPLLKRPDLGNSVTIEGNVERILELIQADRLKVAPLLSHVVPAQELDNAYQGLLHRKDEYMGAVLDWSQATF
jgi:2-desacetyl-2-hydroxyethyl bacteriochlorophyllide A dehydrogenase